MKLSTLAVMLISASSVVPSFAQSLEAVEPAYSEFDHQVRETLLRHPEILLLVFEKLEAQQAEAEQRDDILLIEANGRDLFAEHASGSAPILVEFVDYRCSFCRAQEDRLKEVLPEEVLVIRKHLPILGPESLEAAAKMIAIEMIYGSELSEQMHSALMGGGVPLARFDTQAASLGIDPRRVFEVSRSAAVQETIAATRDLAQRLGIDGTPGIVTRTRIFRGMVDGEDLHSAVFESVK